MRNRIAIGLVMTAAIFGQQTNGPKLEFEVASVRRSAPPAPGGVTVMGLRGGPGSTDPERMSGKIDLRNALLRAFDVPVDQLSGPDWMQTERYDFEAVVPAGATPEQFKVMLQNLLVERFQIAMHTAKKTFSVYEMVVAKGGLKMKPSTAEPAPSPDTKGPTQADPAAIQAQAEQMLAQLRANAAANNQGVDPDGFPALPEGNRPGQRGITSNGRQMITARGQSMSAIVRTLQNGLGPGSRVVDKTGLTGLYDFKLQFTRSTGAAAAAQAPGTVDAGDPGPDLAGAAQSQLGLKLEKTTAQFDVLIIDHIEKTPTEN